MVYVVSISHFNGKLSTNDEIVLRIYMFKGLQLLVPIETKYRNRIESPQGSHLLLNIRKCQLFECSIFVWEVLMKMRRRAWMLSWVWLSERERVKEEIVLFFLRTDLKLAKWRKSKNYDIFYVVVYYYLWPFFVFKFNLIHFLCFLPFLVRWNKVEIKKNLC